MKTNEVNKRFERDAQAPLDNILPWLLAGFTALISQWAAPSLKNIFEFILLDNKIYQGSLNLDIFYVVLFIISFSLFALYTKKHFKPRTKTLTSNIAKPSTHLFLFLSLNKLNISDHIDLENNGIDSLVHDLNNIKKHKKDVEKIFWSWEMPLYGISYHSKKLQEIILVCSPESLKQLKEFNNFILGYLKDTKIKIKTLVISPTGNTQMIDINELESKSYTGLVFENFDQLSTHLFNAIKILKKRKIKAENIMIDFTGGQKVNSVVGATLTYNSNINLQYISTGSLEVIGYNIVYGT